jgi:hypothetical protein
MLTFRVGAAGGSPRSGAAMAAYLTNETLSPGNTERAAYYSGEVIPEPLTRVGELGVAVAEGDISYSDALNELVRAELRFRPPGEDLDVDALEDGIHAALAQAATRHELAQEAASAGGTSGELRPDLSPAMAAKLGIADSLRPLTKEGRSERDAHRPGKEPAARAGRSATRVAVVDVGGEEVDVAPSRRVAFVGDQRRDYIRVGRNREPAGEKHGGRLLGHGTSISKSAGAPWYLARAASASSK